MSFFTKLTFHVFVATQVFAQTLPVTDARPEFEVTSVRTNNSGLPTGSLSGTDRTRFSARNITLNLLIRLAWNVREYQILGGPAWINSDRFDISAKTPVEVENDQMMLMLQRLLEDRFSLVIHHETRELPVYALVISKRGPKLHAGECSTGEVPPGSVPCGRIRIFTNGMDGQTSVPLFINVLSDLLGLPVTDETKIAGPFDIRLRWTPDGSTPGNRSGDSLPAADGSEPSFFTALEEQLGLRLESRKGPVETITIEHAEKSHEN